MKTIKWMLLMCGFLLVSVTGSSQESITEKKFQEVDEMPEYRGGLEALTRFFQENLVYPEEAKKQGIQEKVFVSFEVDESGEISEPKVVRGANDLLDKEALRVVKMMPAWIPGKKEGKPVKVAMTLPVMFALDGDEKTQ